MNNMSSLFKLNASDAKLDFGVFLVFRLTYFSVGNFFEHDWLVIQLKNFTQFFLYFLVLFSAFRSLHTLNFMRLESVSLLFLNY